jgi:response regulator RpfG family c-di-GMP phosphodiesterase
MVIMISAVKDIESAISAMSKGAYDYVTKPFKLNEVALNARRAINNRKLILEKIQYKKNLEIKVEERTRELKDALDKLNATYTNTLTSLVLALDARDTETQGHSLRVVQFSLTLAGLLGITDSGLLQILEYGALLHDIGKIGIPDAILRKPGSLSPKEWDIMKRHPTLGYKIIEGIDFLKDASLVVLHHHEKFDGSGYPMNLSGDAIPLGARIFAVADAVDAMTSERPYRGALTFEEATAELKKFEGIQFDPAVVHSFFKVPLSFWKKEGKTVDHRTDFSKLFNLGMTQSSVTESQ